MNRAGRNLGRAMAPKGSRRRPIRGGCDRKARGSRGAGQPAGGRCAESRGRCRKDRSPSFRTCRANPGAATGPATAQYPDGPSEQPANPTRPICPASTKPDQQQTTAAQNTASAGFLPLPGAGRCGNQMNQANGSNIGAAADTPQQANNRPRRATSPASPPRRPCQATSNRQQSRKPATAAPIPLLGPSRECAPSGAE